MIAGFDLGPHRAPLSRLAVQFGIHEILREDISVDSMMIPEDEGFVIVLNSNQVPARQDFSLAHELVHLILAKSTNPITGGGRLSSCAGVLRNPIERLCNSLASQILMPEAAFRELAEERGWKLTTVHGLQSVFATSFEATARRLVELSPSPLALLPWRLDARGRPIVKYGPVVSPKSATRTVGFIRRLRLDEMPSLSRAYFRDGLSQGGEPFLVAGRGRYEAVRELDTASLGFASGAGRYVCSLANLS